MLVAKDGEWTRRRIAGPAGARKLARSMRIPVYDVQIVGYPQRMRDHDARQRILREPRTPPQSRRQPFSAMSASTAASVRTGTPVPPFVV